MLEQATVFDITPVVKENALLDEVRAKVDRLQKVFPGKVVILDTGTKLYRVDNRPQARVEAKGITTRHDPIHFTDQPHPLYTNMTATMSRPLIILDVRKDEGLTMDMEVFNKLLEIDEDPENALKTLEFDGFVGTGAAKHGRSDFVPDGSREIVVLPDAVSVFNNGIELYQQDSQK